VICGPQVVRFLWQRCDDCFGDLLGKTTIAFVIHVQIVRREVVAVAVSLLQLAHGIEPVDEMDLCFLCDIGYRRHDRHVVRIPDQPSAERRIGNEPDAESRGLSSAWRETQIDGKGAPKRPFMMRKMRRPRYFRGTTGSRLNL
jgi:hypothetical protein